MLIERIMHPPPSPSPYIYSNRPVYINIGNSFMNLSHNSQPDVFVVVYSVKCVLFNKLFVSNTN